jgi:hypothetical protein
MSKFTAGVCLNVMLNVMLNIMLNLMLNVMRTSLWLFVDCSLKFVPKDPTICDRQSNTVRFLERCKES